MYESMPEKLLLVPGERIILSMNMRQQQPKQWLCSHLPQLLLGLILLQPTLDVLSFWQSQAGVGNGVTLLLRFAMLLTVALAGFYLSEQKRLYVALAAVLLGFGLCHCAAVLQVDMMTLPEEGEVTGLRMLLSDLANYARVAQIPVFTLSFATFLKRSGEGGFRAIQKGFVLVLLAIAAVELLSVFTGTNPYTYPNKSLGVLGWFYFANSQSAILSVLVPVSIMAVIRRKERRPLLQVLVCLVGFGVLFFFGTRLTFAAIFATAIGLVFTLLVADRQKKRAVAVLLVCAGLCLAAVQYSPMYQNQSRVGNSFDQKQARIDAMIEGDSAWAAQYGAEGDDVYERCRLVGAYHFYAGDLVEKYGLARVVEIYDYSTNAHVVADVRLAKRNFCTLMMEDSPMLSRLFGLELGDLRYGMGNYDMENDFHGIYVLYGAVGLALLAGFFLYFVGLILWALLKNAKKYYTPEAGAYGVAFIMLMLHAFATAGLLRRPNASFYLSVVLAVIFYLVRIRRYKEQNTAEAEPVSGTAAIDRKDTGL